MDSYRWLIIQYTHPSLVNIFNIQGTKLCSLIKFFLELGWNLAVWFWSIWVRREIWREIGGIRLYDSDQVNNNYNAENMDELYLSQTISVN